MQILIFITLMGLTLTLTSASPALAQENVVPQAIRIVKMKNLSGGE